MAMPNDLVLVRHGESEGNVAMRATRQGDDSYFTPAFLQRHSSWWRLTADGARQASLAGAWVKQNIGSDFDRYYTSAYVRAMETAARLELPEARWYINTELRERDWGVLDRMTQTERMQRYAQEIAERHDAPLYWRPPNGESIAQTSARLRSVLDTLHRECSGQRVIIVCHGEVMEAFRFLLMRMEHHDYMAWSQSRDPADRIHNCQVHHYTRVHPETGEISRHLGWWRSACAYDPSLADSGWQPISRPIYDNESLMALVQKTKPLPDPRHPGEDVG